LLKAPKKGVGYMVRGFLSTQNQVLPKTSGEWLSDGIFQIGPGSTYEGKLCFDIDQLEKRFPWVGRYNWYRWLRGANPDTGSAFRAFLVPNPNRADPAGGNRTENVLVWLQQDAKSAADARASSGHRVRFEAFSGEWLNEELWQDDEFGTGGRDNYLARRLKRSAPFFGYWRDHPHPALDPKVNGGKPRFRQVPGQDPRHPHKIYVSCLEDFKKIIAWDDEEERRAAAVTIPSHWRTAKEIAADRNITKVKGKIYLSAVLKEFRRKNPVAAMDRKERSSRNQLRSTAVYDPEAFDHWLAGRSIRTVAAALVGTNLARERRRLQKAVRFLQFVLTQGRYGSRAFKQFLKNPPSTMIQPSPPILKDTVLHWSKLAGVELQKALKEAKKIVGVKHQFVGFGSDLQSFWFLEGPISVRAVNQDAGNAQSVSESQSSDAEVPPVDDPKTPRNVQPPRGRGRQPGSLGRKATERRKRIIEEAQTGRYSTASELARVVGGDPSGIRKILKDAGITLGNEGGSAREINSAGAGN
jgi:hypothetical protein